MKDRYKLARLCFVKGNIAYFTTQDLSKQWGDDWNDTPYEHNAGEPYTDHAKKPSWHIYCLMFNGCFLEPCSNQINSPFSVEQINKRLVPWLKSEPWADDPTVNIWAGTDMKEFYELIVKAGGKVYREINGDGEFK